ncbi:MAG TPA: DUF4446 family protein [Solirubrobacteraceae bacterium]|nr:DUF4446 family protein [Solirubrobacteraceae bacterium]
MDASTAGIIAIAAGVIALAALALALRLIFTVRTLRAAQKAVLGTQGEQDLIAYATGLAEAFDSLQVYVEQTATRLDARLGTAETRLDASVAYSGLVRYDALNEMSGRQSTSIALLDARKTGIVLTSIHHRDQARLYAKLVHEGRGDLELSPEEADVIRQALENPSPSGGQAGTA